MKIFAEINPAILKWARSNAGLSVEATAKKVGISSVRLEEWERGESFPTIRQLRLIGKAYRRPSAFFYLNNPPSEPAELPDFRKVPEAMLLKSPELMYEIRLARARRQTAVDLILQLGEEPNRFDVNASLDERPNAIAQKMRVHLGISLDTQLSWRDPYEGLRSWTGAAEKAGILVCQFSGVDIAEARGFSISERPYPVISLNGKDFPRGRIFTLIHEIAHISVNLGGLCDLHYDHDNDDELEPIFNHIAGEFLVPTEALLNQDIVVSNDSNEWSDLVLQNLANLFMVSREVILRRLLNLGKTTIEFYRLKREQFIKEYTARRRSGFIEYYRKVLRNNGIAFTSILYNAYYNDVISMRDLSRYLGNVKLKHVNTIEHELGLS